MNLDILLCKISTILRNENIYYIPRVHSHMYAYINLKHERALEYRTKQLKILDMSLSSLFSFEFIRPYIV